MKLGALRLTAGFTAPECFLTAKDGKELKIAIGVAVDYYALGMTVYMLATGNNPFTRREFLSIASDTAEGRIADYIFSLPEAASINGRVNELIRGLIAVNPVDRWGSKHVTEWLRG
jgi:serine/threonine protein kinase